MPNYFFTIITSNLNSANDLAATAKSIEQQTFKNLQWIISDGASTDNSIKLIEPFQPKNTLIYSSPDTGIYNAWNKVLPQIEGKWVIFLGAGDTFSNNCVLEKVFNWMNIYINNQDTICYGSVLKVPHPTATTGLVDDKKWRGINSTWSLGRPAIPCHQGIFHRASLFQHPPTYDESFRIAADSEIVLRELMADRGKDMNILTTHMLTGGISSNKKYRALLVFEIIRINWRTGIFFKRPFLQMSILLGSWVKYSILGMYK